MNDIFQNSIFAGVTLSLVAYMIGDLMNDKVFRKLKEKQGEKGFCVRAIISSLVGELCDSCIFIPLGMNILPKLFLGFEFMSWNQIAIAIPAQALCKTLYESCIVPITATVTKAIKKYEHSLSIENNVTINSKGV